MLVVVIGACGLLGRAVVARLRARDHQVTALDRDPAVCTAPADAHVVTDIGDRQAVTDALAGVDAVVHTASLIDLHLGKPQRLHDVNVTGVQNVIDACRSNGVQRLVHMSSAEVVTGATPLRGVDEVDARYPSAHLTYYGIQTIEKPQVPRAVADLAASFYEWRYRRFASERYAYPRLTKHSVRLAIDDYSLDGTKIREALGYEPPFTRAEAIERTQSWLIANF